MLDDVTENQPYLWNGEASELALAGEGRTEAYCGGHTTGRTFASAADLQIPHSVEKQLKSTINIQGPQRIYAMFHKSKKKLENKSLFRAE